MAGYSPPKDPSRRARRNKDTVPTRIFAVQPVDPYPLPDDLLPDGEGWHPATVRWWQRWCDSPLAADLPAVDWSELEATAVLHQQYMKKRSFTLAGELRLRMQLFGATPLDRARLRMQVVNADAAEADMERRRTATSGATARSAYGDLRLASGGTSATE